jgi:hypothetical protein
MSRAPIVVTKKDVKHGAWHYLKPALMILCSLPLLYILGSGPAAFIVAKEFEFKPTRISFTYPILSIYYPIFRRASQSQSIDGRCLRAYINLWLPQDARYREPPVEIAALNLLPVALGSAIGD